MAVDQITKNEYLLKLENCKMTSLIGFITQTDLLVKGLLSFKIENLYMRS